MPFEDAKPWRTPEAATIWFSGLSPLKTWPTSNSATSEKPRLALACAAATRPGSRLGRMSERSAAIGLATASSACPPPNNSAAGFEMNDHVTASTMPRAASARLARRVRSWICVSTGLRGASPRSNGVIGTLSTPTMRTISSTMSALPPTSRAPRRHRDLHDRTGAGDHEAETAEDQLHFRERHLDAGEPLDLGQRKLDHPVLAEGLADDDVLGRRAAAHLHHQSWSRAPAPAP